jgi:cytidine deaminase
VAAESLKLVWPGEGGRVETRELRALLPEAFGPETLGIHARLLGDASALPRLVLQDSRGDPARERALEAATKSYAPYTHGRAGCALETSAGRMFVGRYAENAAYNPSLSAGQTALAMMNVAPRREGERITRVVLVERVGSVTQLPIIACLMEAAAPGVEVERFEANDAVSRQ